MQLAAEHDGYFGRGQIYIDLQNAKRELPLILSDKTVKKGTLLGFRNVEPMWTTPVTFNALDPADPYFYNPQRWWVMGQDTHSSRLLTIITRPVPDMLKPAFNFGGISL